MINYITQVAVLRIQAEGLKQHANSLDSWAQNKDISADNRKLYRFARDAARDEAEELEKSALRLESDS